MRRIIQCPGICRTVLDAHSATIKNSDLPRMQWTWTEYLVGGEARR